LQPFQGFLWLDCTCWGFQASGMPDMKCPAFLQPQKKKVTELFSTFAEALKWQFTE